MNTAGSPNGIHRSPTDRRQFRAKRWLFCGMALLLVVGTIEFTSTIVWMTCPPIGRDTFSSTILAVAALGTERTKDLEVLHPYLGWAFNPDAAEIPAELTVNSLGFVDTRSSIQRRSPDRLVVGIFGGSVAQQTGTIGRQALCDRLAASPILGGRQIEIVQLAMSGYKQPQQLIALNYVLALGAEFDIVVNIDGYNETGLIVGENDVAGVFAAYPRAWHARLKDVVDPRTSATSFDLLSHRARRQARAQWLANSFLRQSPTANLMWAIQDQVLKQQQVKLGLDLVQHTRDRGFGFARQGPRQMYSNDDEMYEHITGVWKNCSLQMYHLCRGRGIRYLHFLQPNQYHEGSKVLSSDEIKKYYAPLQTHAQGVKHGYPHLIAAGSRLQNSGVDFHDLTRLFASETDTIYSDYFCHYNARGTIMLAEAVASAILKSLSDDTQQNP